MHERLNFAIVGRISASKIAEAVCAGSKVHGLILSRDNMHSFEEICDMLDCKSFFVADESSKNYFIHIKNSIEFMSLINNYKDYKFFQIYKHIDGLKISFNISISSHGNVIIHSFSYNGLTTGSVSEDQLEDNIGADLKNRIYQIINDGARFISETYFTSGNLKMKFIIGTDKKVYLYKLYKH